MPTPEYPLWMPARCPVAPLAVASARRGCWSRPLQRADRLLECEPLRAQHMAAVLLPSPTMAASTMAPLISPAGPVGPPPPTLREFSSDRARWNLGRTVWLSSVLDLADSIAPLRPPRQSTLVVRSTPAASGSSASASSRCSSVTSGASGHRRSSPHAPASHRDLRHRNTPSSSTIIRPNHLPPTPPDSPSAAGPRPAVAPR